MSWQETLRIQQLESKLRWLEDRVRVLEADRVQAVDPVMVMRSAQAAAAVMVRGEPIAADEFAKQPLIIRKALG